MRDVNELNDKIAELEKQRDALAEKTGGFKVGDKVVLEGVVSEIEASWSFPIKVTMKGINYGHFRPDHLRHADAVPDAEPVCWANFYGVGGGGVRVCTHGSKESAERTALYSATEIAVPLYRITPDASKRIAELEKQCEKIKAEAKRWKEAYQDSAGSANLTNMGNIGMVYDLVEARKEIEDLRDMVADNNERIDLLQDWLAKASAFKSKPACDKTCDKPDECCNSVTVAPKGVKEEIVGVLDRINVRRTEDPCAVDYALMLAVDAIRSALGYIVELPEPKGQIDFIRPDDVLCARIKTPVIIDGKVQSKCEAMLHLAAALVQAAKGGGE